MSVTPVQRIATQSRGDLATAPIACGYVWRSHRSAAGALSYEAEVPQGLHIALGTAHVRTSAAGLGGGSKPTAPR